MSSSTRWCRTLAYNSLLKSGRKHIHASIAEALAKSGDVVASAPEVLAHHYMEAGKFEPAAAYWCQAAERAGARYANRRRSRIAGTGWPLFPRARRTASAPARSLRFASAWPPACASPIVTAKRWRNWAPPRWSRPRTSACSELSRIHHLRGNIYYPLGRVESCFAEHEAALALRQERRLHRGGSPRARRVGRCPLSGGTHPASPPALRGMRRTRAREWTCSSRRSPTCPCER